MVYSDKKSHKCGSTCYCPTGEEAGGFVKPEKGSVFIRGGPPYYAKSPLGRILLDAMNRVKLGWLGSKWKYDLDAYKEVVEFAREVGIYDPKFVGKDEGYICLYASAFPGQPVVKGPLAKALEPVIEHLKAGGKGAAEWGVSSMAQGAGSTAAKAAVVSTWTKEAEAVMGTHMAHLALNMAQGMALSGGGAGGWAIDGFFHAVVDKANAKKEREALAKELEKAPDERDLSKMMTSLRTLLKDEHKFEEFAGQFSKVVMHLNRFNELNKKDKLASCEEAYDLAVAMFEVKKHLDKGRENEQLLDLFSQIVTAMVSLCRPDGENGHDGLEKDLDKAIDQWLTSHPKKHCPEGVCYQRVEVEADELAREDGSVVYIKM
ncbi:MAG TPA: hypothetical protein VHF22_01780 [Planctomycetota bacterium]|nr:hypothetical protein [Planctomycetota bacterium]